MLKINMEYRKGILFIRLKGDLTKYTVSSLNNYLMPVISKHGIKYLVYNLGAVSVIDSFGKASLKLGVEAVKLNQGEALLCNVNSSLSDEFRVVDSELTALSLIGI